MWGDRIVTVVEIDIDTCSRIWGVGVCSASFNSVNRSKCYNTFSSCQRIPAYNKTVKTIRFCSASFPIKTGNYIPAILGDVAGSEQEINIAGFKPNIGSLGVRASVKVRLQDFPDRDTLTDPYWEQRLSGAAQANGIGYDPMNRGTFWTKFKSRNPNYAGRPLRVITGRVSNAGDFIPEVTRSYVMTEMKGPGKAGEVEITASDVLALASDKMAQAPVVSRGRILADMNATQTTLTLSPAGIGPEYPTTGYITIGSELLRYTRTGDNMTVERGMLGSTASTHSANDTAQLAFHVNRLRADYVIQSLLINYAKIPASYIDYVEWKNEFDRWGDSLVLSATICKPTGVTTLIGEINQLGITVWWDEVTQKIRVRLNRPPDATPATWSDRDNIMSVEQEDNDDERATRIAFWHVQIDPTKELGKENFLRGYINVFVDGESPNFYGESRTKTIYSRWLNHGADSAGKVITGRLLNRYKIAPITYTVTVDSKDNPSLADVVSLNSHVITDINGLETPSLTQVFYRKDERNGSTVTVKLQRFQFDARYGVITENTRPRYPASTEAQKSKGTYIVGPSLVFGDGRPAYQLV